MAYTEILYDVQDNIATLTLNRPEKRPAEYQTKISKDLPSYFPWWEEPDYG